MSNYQRIIVAVDLEHEAEKILDKALMLACGSSAEIKLVHILQPLSDAMYASGLGLIPPLIDIAKLELEALEDATTRLAKLAATVAGLETTSEVIVGQPATSIVDAADTFDADIIVLGSHGKKGIQLLLGSTASGVLHHAKCDTLMARM